jgi:hypothetical protein
MTNDGSNNTGANFSVDTTNGGGRTATRHSVCAADLFRWSGGHVDLRGR